MRITLSCRHTRSFVRADLVHGGVWRPWRRMTAALNGSSPRLSSARLFLSSSASPSSASDSASSRPYVDW